MLQAQARELVQQRQRRWRHRRRQRQQLLAALAAALTAPPASAEAVSSCVQPPEQGLPDGTQSAAGCRRALQTAWLYCLKASTATKSLGA